MAPAFTQSGQCPNQIECIAKLPSMFQMSQRLEASPVARRTTVFLKRQLCSPHFLVSYHPRIGLHSTDIDLCDPELIVRSLSDPGFAFSGMRGSNEMVCHGI
jgi:hypothetical protein